MASSKVYVGGLPWTCNADDLRQVCSKFGLVEDAFIVMDKTGVAPRSKGFGFVTFSDANDAATCLRSLNGTEYGGRVLKVGMAHKETGGATGGLYGRQQRGFGSGSFGSGGYGRGDANGDFTFRGGYSQPGTYSGGYGASYGLGDSSFVGETYGGGASYGSSGGYNQFMQGASSYGSSNRGFGSSNQYGGYSSLGDGYSYGGTGY